MVGHDRSLYTVKSGGVLEIRGEGWDLRRRKGDTENTDRPRVCKFESVKIAKRIAELVDEKIKNL